jgi:hypothetical protein
VHGIIFLYRSSLEGLHQFNCQERCWSRLGYSYLGFQDLKVQVRLASSRLPYSLLNELVCLVAAANWTSIMLSTGSEVSQAVIFMLHSGIEMATGQSEEIRLTAAPRSIRPRERPTVSNKICGVQFFTRITRETFLSDDLISSFLLD